MRGGQDLVAMNEPSFRYFYLSADLLLTNTNGNESLAALA